MGSFILGRMIDYSLCCICGKEHGDSMKKYCVEFQVHSPCGRYQCRKQHDVNTGNLCCMLGEEVPGTLLDRCPIHGDRHVLHGDM